MRSELKRFGELLREVGGWEYPYSKTQAALELVELTVWPSLRVLSARWGWSKSATHRFVTQMRSDLRDFRGTDSPKKIKKIAEVTEQITNTSGDGEGTGHNPPPTWLCAKPSPLVSYPDPSDPGHVWMTEGEWAALVERVGSKECAEYLAQRLENYIQDNLDKRGKPAKKVQYRDHFRTLLAWFARSIDDGKQWGRHPQGGWGFWRGLK